MVAMGRKPHANRWHNTNLNNSDWHCVCLEQVPHILPGVCGCVQQHCLRDLQMLEALFLVLHFDDRLFYKDLRRLIPSTSRPERRDMLLQLHVKWDPIASRAHRMSTSS